MRILEDRLQRQWEICRLGLLHCESHDHDRERVLDWLSEDGGPFSTLWIEIVLGDRPDLRSILLQNTRFPSHRDDAGSLRQLVTSSPFSLIRELGGRRQ